MPGGAGHPAGDPRLLIVPDALAADGQADGGFGLHPGLAFAARRLQRAAWRWFSSPAMAPIEWYATLIGAAGGASSLLAAAMVDRIPADARQCWLFSPFAGKLGRDRVHIMPEAVFAWDARDAEWLVRTLQPMLAGDGITLLVRDACVLAVCDTVWDASPASFAQVSGHVLPNRHPPGADGGRLMRLCAEMQMLLAVEPSERRRTAGLPEVMGVWLWAPSMLPASSLDRPDPLAGDALIRACTDGGMLPVAIMHAAEIEAWREHQRSPRYWLLAGDGHALLADTRAWPRIGRRAWRSRNPGTFDGLAGRLRRIIGEAIS